MRLLLCVLALLVITVAARFAIDAWPTEFSASNFNSVAIHRQDGSYIDLIRTNKGWRNIVPGADQHLSAAEASGILNSISTLVTAKPTRVGPEILKPRLAIELRGPNEHSRTIWIGSDYDADHLLAVETPDLDGPCFGVRKDAVVQLTTAVGSLWHNPSK